MAERRMFAKTIVTSDAFLDMPLSARCLYFTLGMFADDDGFVNNPKSIMRQVGACTDDLNLLLLKRFILKFDSGVIVIKHWRIHNYIQKDRYKETKYIDEKATLMLDEKGAYTECIQGVYSLDTQEREEEDRIGKDISFNHSIASEEEAFIQKRIEEEGFEGEDAEVYREELRGRLKLKYMTGTLGQGVVLMSEAQFSDLCDKLTLDEIDKYMGIIVECEKNGKRYKKKSHYQAILDMAAKDRRISK